MGGPAPPGWRALKQLVATSGAESVSEMLAVLTE
jgi:hypothetical protein